MWINSVIGNRLFSILGRNINFAAVIFLLFCGLLCLTAETARVEPVLQNNNQRIFILKNSCTQKIWVGAIASADDNPGVVPQWWTTGRDGQPGNDGHLQPGEQQRLTIPSSIWKSARIWARTGCNTSFWGGGQPACVTGDCGGLKTCQTSAQTISGDAGATLAEFTLDNGDNDDFYDVSAVDGFNIPMTITPVNPFRAATGSDFPFENCGNSSVGAGIAGFCFKNMKQADWEKKLLQQCPSQNQIFGEALQGLSQNCPTGTSLVNGSSSRLCIANPQTTPVPIPQAFKSFCLSDAHLESLPNGARGTNPPAGWPPFADKGPFACPGPPKNSNGCPPGTLGVTCFTTDTCPANYHSLAPIGPGKAPFINWPKWFADRCSQGAYGYTYDDKANTYKCRTFGRSNAYLIEFCPGDASTVNRRRR